MNTSPKRNGFSATAVLEKIIFESRWILAPMYIGLIVAELVYAYKFLEQLVDLCTHILTLTEEQMLIMLLGLVDFTMVANLVVMILMGGYSIFIKRMVVCRDERPQWLDHVDSTTLKIKMGMSLVGVSSIHLLKTFVDADKANWNVVQMQIAIHILFVVSTLAMAVIYRLSHIPSPDGHGTDHGNGSDHGHAPEHAGAAAPAAGSDHHH